MDYNDRRKYDARDMEVSDAIGEIRVAIARIEAAIDRVAEVQGESRCAHHDLSTRLHVVEQQHTQARAWLIGASTTVTLASAAIAWLVANFGAISVGK